MRRLALVPAALGAALCAACATVEQVEPPQAPKLEGDVPAIGRRLDLEVEGRGNAVRLEGVIGRVTAICVLGNGRHAEALEEAPPPAAEQPPAEAPEGEDGAVAPVPGAGASPALPPVPNGLGAPQGPAEGHAVGPEAGTADANRVDADPEAPVAEAAPGTTPPALDPAAQAVLDACRQLSATLRDQVAVVGLTTDPTLDLDRMPLRTFRDPEGKALQSSLELDDSSRVILVDTQRRVADVLSSTEVDGLDEAAERLAR